MLVRFGTRVRVSHNNAVKPTLWTTASAAVVRSAAAVVTSKTRLLASAISRLVCLLIQFRISVGMPVRLAMAAELSRRQLRTDEARTVLLQHDENVISGVVLTIGMLCQSHSEAVLGEKTSFCERKMFCE
jgi:hypothetical protein